jgi:hypothetical protein
MAIDLQGKIYKILSDASQNLLITIVLATIWSMDGQWGQVPRVCSVSGELVSSQNKTKTEK